MHSAWEEKLQFEISQIEELFSVYEPLFTLVSQRDPDIIELSALATVLHSFYNGVESLFLLISKHIDRTVPQGVKWHLLKGDILSFLERMEVNPGGNQ